MRWLLWMALLGCSACSMLQHTQPVASASAVTAPAVREFVGWAAISGGGPQAKATNTDWHTQDDLRLSDAGGRVPLHWRDGVASGYSLVLKRQSYPERQLVVLQLDVIEDASGKALTYVWASEDADAIGLNLGWLQVGLRQAPTNPRPDRKK